MNVDLGCHLQPLVLQAAHHHHRDPFLSLVNFPQRLTNGVVMKTGPVRRQVQEKKLFCNFPEKRPCRCLTTGFASADACGFSTEDTGCGRFEGVSLFHGKPTRASSRLTAKSVNRTKSELMMGCWGIPWVLLLLLWRLQRFYVDVKD